MIQLKVEGNVLDHNFLTFPELSCKFSHLS